MQQVFQRIRLAARIRDMREDSDIEGWKLNVERRAPITLEALVVNKLTWVLFYNVQLKK